MSKRAYISRYLLIIKKLTAKPYTSYKELENYIENQAGNLQLKDETINIGFSKRTLQRDFKEINTLFGLSIEYSPKQKGYFISNQQKDNNGFERIMEAFDMFHSLNLAEDISPFIYMEKRRPQGTENLYGLLHAIKNKLQVKFDYQKFWEDEQSHRTAEPFALKEFKNRWYVFVKDCKDNHIKSLGLDRLTNLEITNNRFTTSVAYNMNENYRYCFGIINPMEENPEEVILSFNPFQGKYIKTLPLHETQEIITDNAEELRIKLKLFITHDLVMELLSFGNNLTVLKPSSLRKKIKQAHKEAYEQY